MDCSLIRYPSPEADKARIYLTKNDYLKISEYIESLVTEKFSLSEPAKSNFSYRHDGFQASYSTEEFIRNFSTSTKFMELTIAAHAPYKQSMIMFHTNCNNYGNLYVFMESDRHTRVELEDTLDALIAYIESLIIPHIQKPSQQSESLSQKETQQKQGISKPDTCGHSQPKIPFYKNGVFWTAAGVVVAFIIGVLPYILSS